MTIVFQLLSFMCVCVCVGGCVYWGECVCIGVSVWSVFVGVFCLFVFRAHHANPFQHDGTSTRLLTKILLTHRGSVISSSSFCMSPHLSYWKASSSVLRRLVFVSRKYSANISWHFFFKNIIDNKAQELSYILTSGFPTYKKSIC